MRTAQLKINGQTKEGILVAGGPSFKVYSVSDFEGWVVKSGRQTRLVEDGTKEFTIVSQYVNLNYQPASEQKQIKESFDNFILGPVPPIPGLDQEPTL